MKILVFSDSHNNTALIQRALEAHMKTTDLILHLGDCIKDSEIFQKLCPHIANINILGNCDYFYSGKDGKTDAVFTLGNSGKKAFACHGHSYAVNKNTDILLAKARLEKVNIALYGHTHIAHITEQNGILIMNPGSASLSRSTEPASYGIINVDSSGITPSIIFDRN